MPYADPVVWYDFPVDTQAVAIDHIKTILEAAGWTTTSSVKASVVGTFIGQPSDSQTLVVDGVTMTAKTTPGGPTEFALGSTPTEAATNLAACINTNLASVDATSAVGVVTVTGATGGPSGNGIAVSEGLSNFTWAAATLTGGGYVLKSGVAPDRKQFVVFVRDDAVGGVWISTRSVDGVLVEALTHQLATAASTRLNCIAHPYGGAFFRPGSTANNTVVMFQLIWQGSAESGVLITGATNATPIQITTDGAHGMTTGQQVFIDNVGGNTAANGLWTVTAAGGPTSTTLTLDGSVGNGTYTAATGVLASVTGGQRSRNWFITGTTPGNGGAGLRQDISGDSGDQKFVVSNQNSLVMTSHTGRPRILLQEAGLRNEGGRYVVTEAMMRWHSTDTGIAGRVQGGMYNMAYTTEVIGMDEEFGPTPDGKLWICFTNGDSEGALLMRTPAGGIVTL